MAQMLTIGVIAAIVVLAIALSIHWFPESASTSAHKIDTVYDVLLVASVPIFVLVMTVAIYSVVTFRARPGQMDDGPPIHGNTRLEVLWVTVPFLLVTGLAVYAWITLTDIEAKKPGELNVRVIGQQFAWTFQYPAQHVTSQGELVLPKDRPVKFDIRTRDVIHSFFVPQFRLKSDAVPGLTTHIRATPNRVGDYQVVCAELCGLGHSTMRARLRVVPESEFTSWLTKKKGPSAGGGGGAGGGGAASGKQVFASSGCGSCHTLRDAGASGTTGPDLDRLASDATKYGKMRHESPTAYLRESILDPTAFTVPGYKKGLMPSTFKSQLSPAQSGALVRYLLSVSGGKGT
jgi:cytochrome c oxidase subunit II